jgi:2-dehydropantoate 2-reductase
MRTIVGETVAVARADGVALSEAVLLQATYDLGEAMSGALSSTAQDLGRGKLTEIDSLNGYVARRGAALGIPTPVNETLTALVKFLESELPRSN